MAIVKPCNGRLSDETQAKLLRNQDREQWAVHCCETCGEQVGGEQSRGVWKPEQHWPSVTKRTRAIKTLNRAPAKSVETY